MNKFLLTILLSIMLTGCQTINVTPKNPFPADQDLTNCTYPMADDIENDSEIADLYLMSLDEVHLCNKKLEGARDAKENYNKILDEKDGEKSWSWDAFRSWLPF